MSLSFEQISEVLNKHWCVDAADKIIPQQTPSDKEYLCIKCLECEERGGDPVHVVKLAKNKGNYFAPFDFLSDFLLDHSGCPTDKIVLVWDEKIGEERISYKIKYTE